MSAHHPIGADLDELWVGQSVPACGSLARHGIEEAQEALDRAGRVAGQYLSRALSRVEQLISERDAAIRRAERAEALLAERANVRCSNRAVARCAEGLIAFRSCGYGGVVSVAGSGASHYPALSMAKVAANELRRHVAARVVDLLVQSGAPLIEAAELARDFAETAVAVAPAHDGIFLDICGHSLPGIEPVDAAIDRRDAIRESLAAELTRLVSSRPGSLVGNGAGSREEAIAPAAPPPRVSTTAPVAGAAEGMAP